MIPNQWVTQFDPADPVNTPRGVASRTLPQLLAALRSAIQTMTYANVPLDGRLGDFQVDERNGVRIPIHGGAGDIDGSYNSIYMNQGLHADGYGNVDWGTSYVQTVSFDDKGPVAHALLLYGQSVDPASPHYADQLPLYSNKTWPVLPFHEAAIKADPAYRTITIAE
jgi:acyl-homoserine-lactone acylase